MHIYGKFEYAKMYRMHIIKFVINTFVLLLYHKINISIKYILYTARMYIFLEQHDCWTGGKRSKDSKEIGIQ